MEILGIRIDEVTMNEAVNRTTDFLNEDKFHMIFTPNPEMLMVAEDDAEFSKILNDSDMNIPDGNGIVWASKRLNNPLSERVAGFDFIHKIFECGEVNPISFYFLGSKSGVAEKAAANIQNNFSGVTVVGTHDGYFAVEEERELVESINKLKPDILLVALGAPKQERFIYKYKDELNCKIAIGVGGCFDVISGNVKRAPKIFIKLKLEWLYRGLTDFKRLKRLIAIPRFMREVKKKVK